MPNTPVNALPYPVQVAAGPGPDVPADIKALADAIDSKLTPMSAGLLDARPPFGVVGRRYYATDNGHEYLDIGTAWIDKGPAWGAGIVGTNELADNSVSFAKLKANSVGATQIIDDTVGTAELAPGAVTAVEVAAALKPSGGAASATEALRAIGGGAGQVVAGNDARLTNQRTPSDASVTTEKLADGAVTPAKRAIVPACRLRKGVAVNLPANSSVVIDFNVELWDTDAIHDNAGVLSRMVCKTAGLYHIYAAGVIQNLGSNSQRRGLALRLNGGLSIAEAAVDYFESASFTPSTDYVLAVNDYIELVAFNTDPAQASSLLVSNDHTVQLGMSYIGRTV